MPISRRTALKQAFIVAGGAIFLPACAHHTDPATTPEALADTLIPADTTLGAKTVGAHWFALKMIRDCYPKKQQEQYARGLQAFDAEAKKRYGKTFTDCDQTQRNEFVAALDKLPPSRDDLNYFFHENKSLVIRGWLGSQYFLTKIEVYELRPRPLARLRTHNQKKLAMGDPANNKTFDAIVIGSGMSGGWAAKEFTDHGFKTLLLERGRDVKHIKDYPTTNKYPWEFEHYGQIPLDIQQANPVVSRCYAFQEDAMHFFVKDNEHPYVQEKPYDWIRGYQTGGKSLLWARQTQRWSDFDFEGPARDGYAVDWPIRYTDLASWYSHVEKFAGISGNKDGLPQLPDGEFLPPLDLTCVEEHLKAVVAKEYKDKDRHVIYGRCAHLTVPQPIHLQQGRGQCQKRNICQRGCPFGGYFSANASTIPWAERSGHLTLRPFSVVHSILYDPAKGRAKGVKVIDAHTKEVLEFYAPVIFVNAGTMNSNLILLNSTSDRFPKGLGNDNGLLGKYVAFHNYRASIYATHEGFKDSTTDGQTPTNAYMPRFRNLHRQETDFLRGYATAISAWRDTDRSDKGTGATLKQNLLHPKPGPWRISAQMMGETIPRETNQVSLDPQKKDEWGIPQLTFNIGYTDNEEKMIHDFFTEMTEMLTKAGFTDLHTNDSHQAPGLDIHEMGGIRMGHDPKTSLLNKWNQLHACQNVFVTDGACMTSTSTQNPSLTYMAITARAVDYAVKTIKA